MADVDPTPHSESIYNSETHASLLADVQSKPAPTATAAKQSEHSLGDAVTSASWTGMLEGGVDALAIGVLKPLGREAAYMRPSTGMLVGMGTQIGDELVDRGLEKVVGHAFGTDAGHLMRCNDIERIGMTVVAVTPMPWQYKAAGIGATWLLGKVLNYFEGDRK